MKRILLWLPVQNLYEGLFKGLAMHFDVAWISWTPEREFLEQFDYLFCPWIFYRRMRRNLLQNSSTTWIAYCPDARNEVLDFAKEWRKEIGILLLNNQEKRVLEIFHNLGIRTEFFPNHSPLLPEYFGNRRISLFWGGNVVGCPSFFGDRPKRVEFLRKVKAMFPELESRGNSPVSTGPYISESLTWLLFLQNVRISIGYNNWELYRYYTRRLSDSLTTGTIHITRYIPGMEQDFENWKDLIWFKTDEEGLEVISEVKSNYEKYSYLHHNAWLKAGEFLSWERGAKRLREILQR